MTRAALAEQVKRRSLFVELDPASILYNGFRSPRVCGRSAAMAGASSLAARLLTHDRVRNRRILSVPTTSAPPLGSLWANPRMQIPAPQP